MENVITRTGKKGSEEHARTNSARPRLICRKRKEMRVWERNRSNGKDSEKREKAKERVRN